MAAKRRDPIIKERDLAYTRQWNKTNRGKKNALNRKRDCALLKRTPPWLTKDHYRQIEEFYKIAVSLTEATGVPHEVDHIIPLQAKEVSGLHVPWNLQVITKSENMKKHTTVPPLRSYK
jgi:hypothetical protein